ncbi:hypothetical protein AVEN_46957-1 [Araneus ventricosus]|uniref:Uncharacterized protein n=1 Tax=Araneus ventricosus TaxID=182803 RepID=A0A4Y2FMT6_ARAVE|nr:hypothetical protein AVEN_46957-1 [Araneus ventricosus]
MFIPNLKEVIEVVLKNECGTLMSRNKLGCLLFTLNLFVSVPCESPRALSIRLHRAPRVNTLLHLVYGEYCYKSLSVGVWCKQSNTQDNGE